MDSQPIIGNLLKNRKEIEVLSNQQNAHINCG